MKKNYNIKKSKRKYHKFSRMLWYGSDHFLWSFFPIKGFNVDLIFRNILKIRSVAVLKLWTLSENMWLELDVQPIKL